MASSYGSAFSAADNTKLAPGTSHDAGVRRFRNVFDLATNGGGGTQNSLLCAKVREGNVVEGFKLSSGVSLAGVNFTLGTIAEPAKYAAAFAGPAANKAVTPPIKTDALAADALKASEEIHLFPASNLPGAGMVVSSFYTSKR